MRPNRYQRHQAKADAYELGRDLLVIALLMAHAFMLGLILLQAQP